MLQVPFLLSLLAPAAGPSPHPAPSPSPAAEAASVGPLVFDGTGGPGGNFDLVVPSGTTLIFNTVSTVFVGGPGGAPTTQQVAVGGRLDVRDLIVEEGAVLKIEGPRRARILATGSVIVEGELLAEGGNSFGVVTLNTATSPEQGAPGHAAGGRGGTGSFFTAMSTPVGGPGFGAFNGPRRGGRGGETGFRGGGGAPARRGGGGGGGVFGPDVRGFAPLACFDQNIVGLDAEPGFAGSTEAFSAIDPTRSPRGGRVGRSPFRDGDPDNDFYGQLERAAGGFVTGELRLPWAGAGGGAGGDAVPIGQFPHPGFSAATDEKGAGGGGGGGSLHIQAVGDVVVGPRGLISVRGGHGGGGENTNLTDRIGGGSGGGSGGHLIVETLSTIDLSAVLGSSPGSGQGPEVRDVGLIAAGGQGGAGAMDQGGATGTQGAGRRQFPCRDAYTVGGCPVPGTSTDPVTGAGGDGGPGVIQLHVVNLDEPGAPGDIVPPADGSLFAIGVGSATCTSSNLNAVKNAGVIKPPPVGAPAGVESANDTLGWDRLVPAFPLPLRSTTAWEPVRRGADGELAPGRLASRADLQQLAQDRPGRRAIVQVQVTRATLGGDPDERRASRWTSDPERLPAEVDWRFVRARVLSWAEPDAE